MTFGCFFIFQILVNVINNYENYTKNKDFLFWGLIFAYKILNMLWTK
jgi:1,4-dihydroxy-2-naphthoate octaprenyltransferase